MKLLTQIKLYLNSQKGVSVLFAVMIMSVILSIALGTSSLLVQQTKMMREIGHSVITFYVADTGIEDVLYKDKLCYPPDCATSSPPAFCTIACEGLPNGYASSSILANGARYDVEFNTSTDESVIIKSMGTYKGNGRALQLIR
jgi:hypothetical protein